MQMCTSTFQVPSRDLFDTTSFLLSVGRPSARGARSGHRTGWFPDRRDRRRGRCRVADHRAQRWLWPADSSAQAVAEAVTINNYSRGLLFLVLPERQCLHCRPTCRPMPPSQSALRCTRDSQTLAIVHPTLASSTPLHHQGMTVTSQVRIDGLKMTWFDKPRLKRYEESCGHRMAEGQNSHVGLLTGKADKAGWHGGTVIEGRQKRATRHKGPPHSLLYSHEILCACSALRRFFLAL